jgi:hypothetical protein
MISRCLATALLEAMQQHADVYHGGKMDMNRSLSAIGDLASGLIAEIDEKQDCIAHFSALVSGIKYELLRKRAQDGAVATRQ